MTSALKRRIACTTPLREGNLGSNSGARRGGLFRKYALVFVGLVVGSLLVSDLIQAYLSYRDKNQTVLRSAEDSATVASSTIERFMSETTAQLGGVVQYTPASLSVDQRKSQYQGFLATHPAFTEIRYLDASAALQIRVSRYSPAHILAAGADAASRWAFAAPKSGSNLSAAYGSIYFQEPCARLAVGAFESGSGPAIISCESQLGTPNRQCRSPCMMLRRAAFP